MNTRLFILCTLCFLCGGTASQAQTTPFFARPAETFEGDAVVFTYRADKAGAIPLEHIQSWKWDFDGNVVNPANASDAGWDVKRTVGQSDPATGLPVTAAAITTTWYAKYNRNLAVNGAQTLTPRLQIVRKTAHGGGTFNQVGITENVIGPVGVAPDPDTTFSVRERSAGNADIRVSFSANPRLAKAAVTGPPFVPAESVRMYSDVQAAGARNVGSRREESP